MQRTFTVFLVAIILLGTLAGCFLLPREEQVLAPPLMEPPEITYEWVEAKRGPITDKFTVSASFQYTKQEPVFFRQRGGRLKAVFVSYGDRVSTGQLLAELDTDQLKNQIRMQEINVEKAKLQAERQAALGQDKYQSRMTELDVRMAQLVLDGYREELAKAQLFSPLNGVVVYLGRFSEGDVVDAYRTIVRVADVRNIQLAYSGIRSSDFSFGKKVIVTVDGNDYEGEVVQTPGTAPVDATDAEKSQVLIKTTRISEDVQAGDSATVTVILAQKDEVIVVPRNLVQMYQGGSYVNVYEDGIKAQRAVEVGLQTATEVEIARGLEEGDLVIVR